MPGSGTPTDGRGFKADQAALEARATDLIRAMDRVLNDLPDPSAVRGAARRLKLDKSLAWRATRIAAAADLAGLLPVLPGGPGRGKLLTALARATDHGDVERLRDAFQALDDEIARRRLDSATLAAMAAGGLDSDSQRMAHLRSRESATEAASRAIGSKATLSISTHVFVGQTATGDVTRICTTSHLGLRRTGTGPNLEIASNAVLREDLSSPGATREIVVLEEGRSSLFFGLATSPRDRIDLVFTSPNVTLPVEQAAAEASMTIRVPADHAILEVWVDRALGWPNPRGAAVEARLPRDGEAPERSDSLRLPMSESLDEEASSELDESFGDARDRHAAIIDRSLAEVARSRGDFTVHRLVVPWPVFMSNLRVLGPRPGPKSEAIR